MAQHEITETEYAVALAAGQLEGEGDFEHRRFATSPIATPSKSLRRGMPDFWSCGSGLASFRTCRRKISESWRSGDGSAIEIEDRDIHLSVHGLMTAILPANAAAARRNGHLREPRRQGDVGGEAQQRAGQRPERWPTTKPGKDPDRLSPVIRAATVKIPQKPLFSGG